MGKIFDYDKDLFIMDEVVKLPHIHIKGEYTLFVDSVDDFFGLTLVDKDGRYCDVMYIRVESHDAPDDTVEVTTFFPEMGRQEIAMPVKQMKQEIKERY